MSVIIPTFNRPDNLERAINSVLKQSYKNTEIIVVDDNNPGTEGRMLTEKLMKKIKNENVYYIQHKKK